MTKSKKIRNRRASIAGRYLDKLADKELSPAYQSSDGSFVFSDRLYNKWIIGRRMMTIRRLEAAHRRSQRRSR